MSNISKKRIKSALINPLDVINSNIKRIKGDTSNDWKLDICHKCEHKEKDNVFGGFMCGYEDEKIEACYCPLKSLVNSKKGCPKKLW